MKQMPSERMPRGTVVRWLGWTGGIECGGAVYAPRMRWGSAATSVVDVDALIMMERCDIDGFSMEGRTTILGAICAKT